MEEVQLYDYIIVRRLQIGIYIIIIGRGHVLACMYVVILLSDIKYDGLKSSISPVAGTTHKQIYNYIHAKSCNYICFYHCVSRLSLWLGYTL